LGLDQVTEVSFRSYTGVSQAGISANRTLLAEFRLVPSHMSLDAKEISRRLSGTLQSEKRLTESNAAVVVEMIGMSLSIDSRCQ
jgi:hypothetical protein